MAKKGRSKAKKKAPRKKPAKKGAASRKRKESAQKRLMTASVIAEGVAEGLRRAAVGEPSRIDRLTAAQKESVESMAEYSQKLAEFVSKGDFSPKSWAAQYAKMVRSMTESMTEMTKAILK